MPRRAVRVCARSYDPRKPSGRANRWNAAGQQVLYLSVHFATAVLESVVHVDTAPPLPSHASWVSIPDAVSVEEIDESVLPDGWDNPDDTRVAREVGALWYQRARSAILVVPSLPGRPFEHNLVVNTTHSDIALVQWGPTVDILWDPRLFG